MRKKTLPKINMVPIQYRHGDRHLGADISLGEDIVVFYGVELLSFNSEKYAGANEIQGKAFPSQSAKYLQRHKNFKICDRHTKKLRNLILPKEKNKHS